MPACLQVFCIRYFYAFMLLGVLTCCKGSRDLAEPTPTVDSAIPVQIALPEAIFNDLNKVATGSSSTVILDKLINLINATPSQETIHLSVFLFKYPPLVAALKNAHTRGVRLNLMLDLSRSESVDENTLTLVELRSFLKENATVLSVKSDAGSSSINHNKFILFSKVNATSGPVSQVVFQTSHNFNTSDTRKVQDAVILSDMGLYQAYEAYWNDMRDRAESGMKTLDYREYVGANTKAFYFPKRRGGASYGGDSIIELLDKISNPASATIRIGMSDWTATRLNIVEKLGVLLDQGAKVELVVKSSIDEEIMLGLRDLEARGAYLKVYNMTEAGKQKVNIHSKFMLIEGMWEGENAQILITGSHNFTNNALRYNNETILLLKNSELYSKYISFFGMLKTIPGL